jgi:hypothetical protein
MVEVGGGGAKHIRMNMVSIMYTHECKCKNNVETFVGIGGGRMKDSSGRG